MPPVVRVLRATQAALDKLGARAISDDEAEQIPRNRHVVIENLRGHRDRRQPPARRLLIGRTDGGRALTPDRGDARPGDLAHHHRMGGDGRGA